MKNIEMIENSVESECYRCKGTDFEKNKTEKCSTCKGTGKWIDSSYILVAKQPNGQKIAFSVDNAGK